MRNRASSLAIVLLIVALVATALAAPKRKPRPHGKKATPAATSGSAAGSAAGSATATDTATGSGTAAVPVPVPVPAPAPAPAPAPLPDTPSNAPGADAAPGASSPASAQVFPPAPTRSLAMRRTPSQAHDGFVSDLDCSACHTADGWGLSAAAGRSGFDHDRTGFPLRGAHNQTTCSGCHSGKIKPATSCEGCHRDPHQGRNEGTCAECHTATAWADTNTLEQHRRTRMPLTGRHATIDCADCHKRQAERVFSDTPADCYACHKADYQRADVHPTHNGSGGGVPFPRDCGLCHRTISWSPAFADPATLPGVGMTARTVATGSHDMYFVLSTGNHRTADCTSCHADQRRMKLVRCDGCHQEMTLRTQHKTPVARTANACLHCHPRGAAR